MKKIVFVLICLILFTPLVNAEGNRLYFSEDGKELVYDTEYFNEKIFMHHVDMYPGKVYQDILDIENGTKNECELFFKVIPVEQSAKANELIENINMEITVDDKLMYDGFATGKDYVGDGINLTNAISLGYFKSNQKSTLVVNTNLNENYEDSDNVVKSYIDWQFYAKCSGVKDVVEINPETGSLFSTKILLMIAIVSLLFVTIMTYIMRKSKIQC